VAIDSRYIVTEVGQLLTRQIVNTEPLIRILPKLGIPVKRCAMEIEAIEAQQEDAHLLRVPPQSPLLKRAATYYSAADEPILCGYSVYRADKVKYTIVVARNAGDILYPV
jgi:GntR family transcriptional regulator